VSSRSAKDHCTVAKKLTIEFIREQFCERRNWDLLEESYINNEQRLRFWCNYGQHEHTITWASFNTGTACGACAFNKPLTIEVVRKHCNKFGLKVLSQVYKNCETALEIECSAGHRFSRSWDCLRGRSTCPICLGSKSSPQSIQSVLERFNWQLCDSSYKADTPINVKCPAGHFTTKRITEIKQSDLKPLVCGVCTPPGKRRLSIDHIRRECLDRGFKVISDEYPGARVPFEVECLAAGHKTWKDWSNIKSGKKCVVCSKGEKITVEYVKEQFLEQNNWTLLSESYKNSQAKLKFYCNAGSHVHSISWNSFQNGDGCGKCSNFYAVTNESVKAYLAERNCILLSEYIRSADPIWVEFECGHTVQTTWNSIRSGRGCGKCRRPEKTKERVESQKIAASLITNLGKALKSVSNKKLNESKRDFCRDLAFQVIKTIGTRPLPEYVNGVEKTFHLDHVVPKSWFLHTKESQVKMCWHVDNFQWLVENRNIAKNNRLSKLMLLQLTPYQIAIANLAELRPIQQENLMKKLGLWMPREEALKKLKEYQTPVYAIELKLPAIA
jgi:hypothetical protein